MFCDIQRIKFLGKAKICVDLKLIFSVFLLFFTLLFEDENQLKTFVSYHRKSCFSEHAQTFDRRVNILSNLPFRRCARAWVESQARGILGQFEIF